MGEAKEPTDPSARLRWETQERQRLDALLGHDQAESWVAMMNSLTLPSTRLVPLWDALHFAMDAYKMGQASGD